MRVFAVLALAAAGALITLGQKTLVAQGEYHPAEQCRPGYTCPQPCPEPCRPACRPTRHVYVPAPECEQPCDQLDDESAPIERPQGAYVAPPRSGAAVGESGSVGVRGPALHFPALTLRLPTLELPSLVRYRHQARMEMEAATAPFVGFPAAPVAGGGSHGETAERNRQDTEAAERERADDEAARLDELKRELAETCAKLKEREAALERQRRDLQEQCERVQRMIEQKKCSSGAGEGAPQPPPPHETERQPVREGYSTRAVAANSPRFQRFVPLPTQHPLRQSPRPSVNRMALTEEQPAMTQH
jgi:hypothetical protein